MRRPALALAVLVAAQPAVAQTSLSEAPSPDGGGVTCAEFTGMDTLSRQRALEAVEPMGGELAGAAPDLVRQWEGEVAAACDGHPDRTVAEAATLALGAD